MAEEKNKRQDSRYDITVHSVRKRLGDVDGTSAKAAIDGLVKGGILPDDCAKYVKSIKYTQEKCKKEEQERTIIFLSRING